MLDELIAELDGWRMKNDLQCPYCGADQEVNHDDGAGYDESKLHEQDCKDCGKTYKSGRISFDYTPGKADCLNGAEHRLKSQVMASHAFANGCKDCDYERQATDEELAANVEGGA